MTLLQGIGLGGHIRFTMYIHNAYLFIATKMGIPALLTFVCFCLAFLSKSWHLYSKILIGQYKQLTLAVLAGFIGIMAWSITQPHLLQTESTVVVALMFGAVASMYRMQSTSADR